MSEPIESETVFGKRVNAVVVGTVGGGTAGLYSKYGGLNVIDPNADASSALSEAEDISADGRHIIGWRHEFPVLSKPPRAFLVSPGRGFQFLDEIFPEVKALAERAGIHGTRGRKVNNSGMMLIESVQDATTGSGHYMVSSVGNVTAIDPEKGLDLDEFGQIHTPSRLVNYPGEQGLVTDLNIKGYVGRRPGFIDWTGPSINLRTEIASQCDNAVIKEQLSDPTGSRPVYINDANQINYGNLLLMPACPEIEFQAQGTSGFQIIDGKVSIRVGTRFKVRTTIRNLERGSIEGLVVTPNGASPFFRQIGAANPPIPDKIEGVQTFVSTAEWEAVSTGHYVGNWTLTAEGSCGPVRVESRTNIAEVLPALKIVVNSTADRGRKAGADCCDTGELLPNGDPECTLRAAIEAVNDGCAGLVEFNIPDATIPRIAPASLLPAITKPSTFDATTQSGKFIELDGTAVNGPGLDIAGGDTVIRGFVIHSFLGDKGLGILLRGPGGNVIAGNRLATDVGGTIARMNRICIGIDNSSLNRIGGSASEDANIIGGIGIAIKGDAEGNRIEGNRIGLGVNGNAFTESEFGVLLQGGRGTVVGGAGTNGNLISGTFGIVISPTSAVEETVIEGNRIGVEANGTSVGVTAGQPRVGIALLGKAEGAIRNTRIADNDIAGHGVDVFLAREHVSGVVVENNRIGLAFNGSTGLPTGIDPGELTYGLRVDRAANVRVMENVIAGHRWDLLISGSEQFEEDPDDGEIFLQDPEHAMEVSPDQTPVGAAEVEGNTIGLNAAGNIPDGTESHSGIVVFGGAQGTLIRDNVVAGHAENEVWLVDGANHVVAGNRLGSPDGIDRGSQTGLLIDDPKSVTVGPSGISPGNTIGWNAVAGIHLRGAAINPLIRMNQVGTDPTAEAAWPNGIGIHAGIEGAPGETTGLRLENNVISGNNRAGVVLTLTNETLLQG